MGIPYHQLPEGLRQRVRAAEASGALPGSGPARPRRRTVPVPYQCHDCGEPFSWTTSEDSTPATVTAHATETGHARYEMVLDGPPPAE